MRIFAWIRDAILWFRETRRLRQASEERASAISNGTFSDAATVGGRDFDNKYMAAMQLIKGAIDQNYPDPYYAKQSPNYDKNIDYTSRRIDALGLASKVISMALRKGATINQAAQLAEVSMLGSPQVAAD